MKLMLLYACMLGPAPLFDLLSALVQREGPAILTRWRVFRLSAIGRVRSALWVLR